MTDPYVGEIRMFAGNFNPRGWLFCSGQLIAISQIQALFALLGTTFGGDGRTHFALPNLKGRAPMGQGSGPGLTPTPMGHVQGWPEVILTTAELPSHDHDMQTDLALSDSSTPGSNDWIGIAQSDSGTFVDMYSDSSPPDKAMSTKAISVAGAGYAHENRQPYLGIYFIINADGDFPPRN